MKILIINGPNLNMTGIRKKDIYGTETLDGINSYLKDYASSLSKDVRLDFYQSNHEGDLIDKIQQSRLEYDGAVINAGAYTHYSYAIRDAIEAVQDFLPYVEVHLSDIHSREGFRNTSVITDVCKKQICGHGRDSYKLAIDLLCEIL